MAVSVNTYGSFRTAEGTLPEVMTQLDDDDRFRKDVMHFVWDGTDYTVVYQHE